MQYGVTRCLVIHAMVFKKRVVLGDHDCVDNNVREAGDGDPYPELAVIVKGQEIAVLIKDLGSGCRAVVFQDGDIRQVGKNPHGPCPDDEEAENKGSESGKYKLFHLEMSLTLPPPLTGGGTEGGGDHRPANEARAVIFLLAALPVRVLVPLTEGIWFHASTHAHAAVELGDGENENKEDQCC
jgi:hypothetical protein